MTERIYFDNSATTPLDPRVLDAMMPYLREYYGNPSSLHESGRQAHAALDLARERVAGLLGAASQEIVFTGSGTEADNLALMGGLEAAGLVGSHLITSGIEHPAVLESVRALQKKGVEVTTLPASSEGLISPLALERAFRANTRMVSIMSANNVVGTLQPVNELGRIAHQHGALFHTDAVQAVGKIPFNVKTQPIDLLSLSAHKLNGPKGVGALYVREGVSLEPVIFGGGQERGLRSATENVAGLVGLGRAAEIARECMTDEAVRLVCLRDQMIDETLAAIPTAYLLGHRYLRLPGHVCLGFAGMEGEAIRVLLALDEAGIAVSSGSACSANHDQGPSTILLAMGLDPVRARGSLRVTLGRFNTQAEVERFLEVLPRIVTSLRPITSRAVPVNFSSPVS